jgi:hypothetical protein
VCSCGVYADVGGEWWCLDVQVLASFSLTRFIRTLLVPVRLDCGLRGNISREVAFKTGQSLKELLWM